ncbi:MAG: GcrA family cell cycle regulator [Pseudomonadota bacterium]
MATWTEERVARLAKLWAEGLSASQIAADLGEVTRNAVIGKVHRLGLSGRDKPAGKGGNRKKATTAKAATKPAAPKPATPRAKPADAEPLTSKASPGLDDVDVKERVDEETLVETKPANDNAEPISRKLTLMQLTENTCKWPTGDPTMPGFSFCGHSTEDDKPYCAFHNKVAFQPPSERRRRR